MPHRLDRVRLGGTVVALVMRRLMKRRKVTCCILVLIARVLMGWQWVKRGSVVVVARCRSQSSVGLVVVHLT